MQLSVDLHIVFIKKQQFFNHLELQGIHLMLNTVYLIESS